MERLNWERRIVHLDERQREGFTKPPELLAHAEQVLSSTFRIAGKWPRECRLPEWLTVPLVAYLIPRVGFNKGGGARRVLSDESLVRLLADPSRFIKDLNGSADGARRWSGVIELLHQEVANAPPKRTPSSKKAKPAGMPGQGGRARAVPKA